MSDPRVTVELLARADKSFKATLSEAWGKQWQEVLNDCGTGKVTLQNDDDDLVLVEYGDFLRFSLDGVPCFVSIVEQMDRVDVAPGEDADEYTVISGRGALALLEDAVIRPDFGYDGLPFGDARAFNFSTFAAISAESNPIQFTPYDFGERSVAGIYAGRPADFPAVFSHWIGGAAPNGSGTNPTGDWYFMGYFFGFPAALYRLYVAWDDAIDLWIDNVPILANEGNTIDQTQSVDVYLADDLHFINAKITNRFAADPNPSGFTAALCVLNSDGTAGTEIWATDPADTNQFVSGYTDPPSFSPGRVAEDLFFEAEILDDVSVFINVLTQDWTSTLDSNGVAWAERINPSFQIGTDFLTAFKQLAETSFDMWVDPATFALNLYASRGSASGAAYVAADNITDLRHTGQF